MKRKTKQLVTRIRAFTLIELLVVISIIALLAAMIVPLAHTMAVTQRKKRVQGTLSQMEIVIEKYKAVRGHYPPDNPNDPGRPPLFYELTGTVYEESPPQTFYRLNGIESIRQANVANNFGVGGFVNAAHVSSRTNLAQIREAEVRDFFPDIKPGQYLTNAGGVAFLGVPVEGPDELTSPDGRKVSLWHYNSSSPTNNPESFDLWMDLSLKGKIIRICNWNDDPVVLN
jgi:prepilin-type N-terminal cleavage/methylation domain-containing protein